MYYVLIVYKIIILVRENSNFMTNSNMFSEYLLRTIRLISTLETKEKNLDKYEINLKYYVLTIAN